MGGTGSPDVASFGKKVIRKAFPKEATQDEIWKLNKELIRPSAKAEFGRVIL